MCLIVREPQNKNRRTVYKIANKTKDGYSTVFREVPFALGEEFVAKGDLERFEHDGESCIYGGAIHVCTDLLAAWRMKNSYGGVILKCSVDPKDWIADGYGAQACYKKITPEKEVESPLKKWWRKLGFRKN